MADTTTVFVKSVEYEQGVSQNTGKPWKRVAVIDGHDNKATSFDLALYDKAKPLEASDAVIVTEPRGAFTDLIDIRPVGEQAAPNAALSTAGGGGSDADARRWLSETAWRSAATMAKADLGFDAAQNLANRIYADLLKKNNLYTDDDIPF